MRIVKTAYLHLSEYLSNLELDDNGTKFRFIDIWNEQTEFIDQVQPFDRPALFFEFEYVDLTTVGLREQTCDIDITLFLVSDSFLDTDTQAWDTEGGLAHLEMCARVHDMLQGYSHPDCGQLNRTIARPFKTNSSLRVNQLTYRTTLLEDTPQQVQHPTVIVAVEPELVIDKRPEAAPEIVIGETPLYPNVMD